MKIDKEYYFYVPQSYLVDTNASLMRKPHFFTPKLNANGNSFLHFKISL